MNTPARIVVVLVVSLVGVLVAWRALTAPSPENDPIRYSMARAAPVYGALPRVECGDGEGFAAEVRAAMARAEVVGVSPGVRGDGSFELASITGLPDEERPRISIITPAMHDALVDQATEILTTRFGPALPAAYLEARAARGAIADGARYEHRYPDAFAWMHNMLLGRPPGPGDSVTTLFQSVFARHRPDAISVGAGLAIAYGVWTSSGVLTDLSDATLGYGGWYGGVSSWNGPMVLPARTAAEIVGVHGAQPAAQVGTVMFYTDRPPRPLVLQFVWDPMENDWTLQDVMITNHGQSQEYDVAPTL